MEPKIPAKASSDRRIDRGQTTRQRIVSTATQLFAEQGYEETSIEAVLQQCGISRGALYHHFNSKEALFTAVLEAAEARIAETVASAVHDATNPLNALRTGCAAWLELARDPIVRRIVLIDAPSVVGWQTWREIDSQHGMGLLKAALSLAAAAGRLRREMVDTYAHLLLAVLVEMAQLIARSEDSAAATRNGQEAVEMLLSRLLGVEPNGSW